MSYENINLYFDSLKDSKCLDGSNKEDNSNRYIILQNDYLHKKVSDLEKELAELRKEKEELEEENESLESAKTSLKGYIKNEGEYNRLSKQLMNHYDKRIELFSYTNAKFIWNFSLFILYIVSVELVFIFSNIYDRNYLKALTSILFDMILYIVLNRYIKVYTELISIKNIKNDLYFIKIKKELEQCEKGNDYLTDLVDLL